MKFNSAALEISCGRPDQFPATDVLEIVFVGRSNVGKSSLINKILSLKHMARVSGTPGKTATINFYKVEKVRFVDLPGYGYAKVSKNEKARWAGLIEKYLMSERNIGLVLQLIDIRHAPSRDDIAMINFLIDSETPFVLILTKRDKLSGRELEERLIELRTEVPCGEEVTMIPFTVNSERDAEELRQLLTEVTEE